MSSENTDLDISNFICILEKTNSLRKEEFLLNSIPFINGTKNIINVIQKKACINPNTLDIGCGTGLTSYLLSKFSHKVTGVDIFEKSSTQFINRNLEIQQNLWNNLSRSKDNLKFKFYNGSKIPFKTGSFDLILLHAVFEHISFKKRESLLNEIYRVLSNKGLLVIARTPDRYSLTEFLTKGHEFKFSKNQLLNIINKNNYKTIHYKKTDFFPEIGPNKCFQDIINYIYPLTDKLDILINHTPLSILSHHHFIIFQKT